MGHSSDLRFVNFKQMRNTNIFRLFLFLQICFFCSFATIRAQSFGDPVKMLDRFIGHAASHKLHLHFNKHHYGAGETMWFSAYLLNSVSHLPDTAAQNVYVDLINSSGVLMEKRIMLARNGAAEGDINLPLSLPDGNYFIRAYTDLMRNFDEEFFFTRYFYIRNEKYEEMIPRSDARVNRRFNRRLSDMAEDFNMAFFPEGGDMAPGVINRVAFKVVDALGRGQEAEGVIIDNAGNEVAGFGTLHAGMGSFEFSPEPGNSYQARVSINEGRPLMFSLPQVRTDGLAFMTGRENGNIVLRLSPGLLSGDPVYTGRLMVVAHTRGEVIYSSLLSSEGGVYQTAVPEELFPSGIAHITVFKEDRVPVAERLVFINREDSFVFSPGVSRTVHEGQQYLGLDWEITDIEGNPVDGHFSMSVLAGGFEAPGTTRTILSNILLSSDLKGVVEDPQHYFDPERDPGEELDLLMMTHGWRRFDWESVLAGDLPGITHHPSSGLSVRGRITDPAKDDPVNNHFIRLKVMSGHDDVYESRTDNRGYFSFDELAYPDNFRIELSSRRLSGNYPPDIDLHTFDTHGYGYTPNIFTREEQITQRGRNWKRVPEAGRSPYAVSPEHGPTPQQYGIPDQTIYIDREKVTHRTVYDVLVERAQGLQIYGNQIMFRGPASINLSSEPMFMLDGVQSSRDAVLSINPREIERIELFRGASASMFGVRGAGGVIIAYTRRAGDPGFQDSKEYMIMGYHTPREFYSDLLSLSTGRGAGELPVRTVYWEPNLKKGEEGAGIIFFPFSGDLGPLKIVVEGIGFDGGIGTGEFTIEVR